MLGLRVSVFIIASVFATLSYSETTEFPTGPEFRVTPGKLCDNPSEYRYPAKIPYCKRNVTYATKMTVFQEYGIDFQDEDSDRAEFKIDHLIPLCMGGSNDISNLWPQHKSVYLITDTLEPLLCEKMAKGRLSQEDAVDMMIEAKTHLEKTSQIYRNASRL